MTVPSHWPEWAQLLYHWQTLITGIIALIIGGMTIVQIRRQIEQLDTLEESRRNREELANRAALPLSLSDTIAYCRDCMEILKKHIEKAIPADLKPPVIESRIIEGLQASARYASWDIAGEIADLLTFIQIQKARFRGFLDENRGKVPPKHYVVDCMIDVGRLYAQASDLFDYGRDEDRHQKLDKEKIRSALRQLGIWNDDHPAIRRLFPRNTIEDDEDL